MRTSLILALGLGLGLSFAACDKKDAASSSPSASEPGAAGAEGDQAKKPPTRSGKIDLPGMKGGKQQRPAMPDSDGDGDIDEEDQEAMRAKFEERRKQRDALLDTDGDGKVSDAERAKARHARAETMRTKLDTDGDGKVTVDELGSSSRLARRLGDTAKLDTDKNGDISTEEIDAALEARPPA